MLTECAPGCECDEEATAVIRYESCAASECSYLYTNQPCQTAFSIGSAGEAHAAEGLLLRYAQREAPSMRRPVLRAQANNAALTKAVSELLAEFDVPDNRI